MRSIEAVDIEVANTNVRAHLHWDDAPQTCSMIADLLLSGPLTGTTHHAIWTGHEFYVYCPAVDLALENHVVRVEPGQLLYYFMPAYNVGMPVHKARFGRKDVAEVAFYYGISDLRIVTEANYRGNLFASVDPAHLDDFYSAGTATLTQGEQSITVRAAR